MMVFLTFSLMILLVSAPIWIPLIVYAIMKRYIDERKNWFFIALIFGMGFVLLFIEYWYIAGPGRQLRTVIF